ncbi:hypothetical protein HW532_12740 [Kaustia mangrovi]|uniref:Uncharacterized protein n=1 Tax=Kaustia mangrovi TaxID=2593653 RepID=A0A7S8HCC8_9HYPH|nr:hypothetical protein [Kaustia mangrovi]QPC43485.1 hypothetical protein HW532_12740 [Kaustia mangrovi]
MNEAVEFIEIDVPICALLYGATNAAGTCPAILGTSSLTKCFNTRATCPVIESYTPEPVTIRFALDNGNLPDDIPAIPSIQSIDFTPGVVSLGEDLGERATLVVRCRDHRWSDSGPGFDKYADERARDPYWNGTFWPRFRARHPSLRGQPIRRIQGLKGQSLAEMVTRHYVIDSTSGPQADGSYTITATDPIALANGDRAQAPLLSEGFLLAAIAEADTTATLSPVGIGATYPEEGWVVISGNEVCRYTRSGDVLTLTRGQKGTAAQEHGEGDRVQLGIEFKPQSPALIIAYLFLNYVPGFNPDWINIEEWAQETTSFLGTPYSGFVAEPTDVIQLIVELIEQAALIVWWDDIAQKLRLRVLREVSTNADRWTEDNTLADTLRTQDQPGKRVSQVWTYYIQLDPTKPLDEINNYAQTQKDEDDNSEATYGSPAIKKIFSRWIPAGGRPIAQRLNEIILSRYKAPPRRFNFAVQRHFGIDHVDLGRGYQLGSRVFQDAGGGNELVPIQTTRVDPQADRFEVEAEEMLSEPPPDVEPGTIVIDFDTLNIDLRELHDSIWGPPVDNGDGYTVNITIEEGVTVGGTVDAPPDWETVSGRRQPLAGTGLPGFDVGDWSDVPFVTRNLINRGHIQGPGGQGGKSDSDGDTNKARGYPGGEAIRTNYPLYVDNLLGRIMSGAGGGAGVAGATSSPRGGGGGAGTEGGLGGVGGDGGPDGPAGTALAGGGASFGGGAGGGPGRNGQDWSFTSIGTAVGGASGFALNGASLIAFATDGVASDNDGAVAGAKTRQSCASVNVASDMPDVKVSAAIEYDGLEREFGENLLRAGLLAARFDGATVSLVDSGADGANSTAYSFAGRALGAADASRKGDLCIIANADTVGRTIAAASVNGQAVADLSTQLTVDDGEGGCLVVAILSVELPSADTTGDISVTFSGGMTDCGFQLYRRVGSGTLAAVETITASAVNPLATRLSDVTAGDAIIAVAGATTSSGSDITGVNWTEGLILGQRTA